MTQEHEAATIARLEEDNKRLRRLLEAKDAPVELRHRLRNTIALLRSVMRKSADSERDLDAYVAHLEDRMDTLMRAQTAADARGTIDLHGLAAEELLYYDVKEGDKLHLAGPVISLQPRAGQLMALAIHELAVNAIEHGSLGSARSRLTLDWRHDGDGADALLELIWKESGAAQQPQRSREGFGMELLTRTLPYELAAETQMEFEAGGLRCTIRLPLTERVGRVEEALS